MKRKFLIILKVALLLFISIGEAFPDPPIDGGDADIDIETSTSSLTADDIKRIQDEEKKSIDEGVMHAQENLGNFQMAWGVIKLLFNGFVTSTTQASPDCRISKAVEFMGWISLLSMVTRLGNWIANAVKMNKILDDMIALVTPNDKAAENIDMLEFYRLLIDEYHEAERFALFDMTADAMDLTFSSIDLVLTIIETVWTRPGAICNPIVK